MIFTQLPKLIDKRGILPRHTTKEYAIRNIDDITTLVIHHSLTKSGSATAFATYHVNTNNWPGIGYHFVIEKDGDIIWCNDLTTKTYHVGNSNKTCVGICLIGDFRVEMPTNAQIKSMMELTEALISDLNISIDDIKGHSEMPGYDWKQCPVISVEAIRTNLLHSRLDMYIEPQVHQQYYLVRPGDTIWGIAHEQTFLRTKELLLINPDVNPAKLIIGQRIKLY